MIYIYSNYFVFSSRIIGSILIVIGLYMVLWGKGRELEKVPHVGGKSTDEDGDPASFGLPVSLSPSKGAAEGQN